MSPTLTRVVARTMSIAVLLVAGVASGEPPRPAAPVVPQANVPLSPALRPLRAQLAPALRMGTQSSRERLLAAIGVTLGHLDRAVAATSFDERVARYRDALDAFIPAYDRARRDPAMQPHRASLDRAVRDALATLPPSDPLRPLLEALAELHAIEKMKEAQEPARYDAVLGVLRGVVIVVVANVIAVSTFGAGTFGAGSTLVRLDTSKLPELRAQQDAALAKALRDARSTKTALVTADDRLKAAVAALRWLMLDLRAALRA